MDFRHCRMMIPLVSALMVISCGRDLSQYDVFKEPRITTLPRQKMIVAEAHGDPSSAAGKAFGAVFKMAYKIKGKVKGMKIQAPRARWPNGLDTPKEQWVGYVAMPVPEEVTALPEQDAKAAAKAKLEYWEYGEVAEILHVGAYGDEPPTVQKLIQFIQAQGYKIAGPHEEEYLKGPGMFFKGNPDNYKTILRYQIAKADVPATDTASAQSPLP